MAPKAEFNKILDFVIEMSPQIMSFSNRREFFLACFELPDSPGFEVLLARYPHPNVLYSALCAGTRYHVYAILEEVNGEIDKREWLKTLKLVISMLSQMGTIPLEEFISKSPDNFVSEHMETIRAAIPFQTHMVKQLNNRQIGTSKFVFKKHRN